MNKENDELATTVQLSAANIVLEKKIFNINAVLKAAAAVLLVVIYLYFLNKPGYYIAKEGRELHLMKKRALFMFCLTFFGMWLLKNQRNLEKPDRTAAVISAVLSAPSAFLIMEYITNADFANVLEMKPLILFLNIFLLMVLLAILLCITNSLKIAPVFLMLLALGFAAANYFVYVFRGIPIMASDVLTIGTALDVAGDYAFKLRYGMLASAQFVIVYAIWLCKLKHTRMFELKGRIICTACTAAVSVVTVYGVVLSSLLSDLGVEIRMFRPMDTYKEAGCAVTFARSINYTRVNKPKAYSLAKVKAIASKYSSDSALPTGAGIKLPNIITVVNESFADISVLGNINTDKEVMPFINSLKENTVRGWTYASIAGGQTANTEFEFLTGNSMAFLPGQVVAFQMFVNKSMGALPTQLKRLGYVGCKALHPFTAQNYSRPKVYTNLGFTEFLSKKDMPEVCEYVRGRISDEDSYKKVIEEYEAVRAKSDKPFYMYDLTIQNHSPYDKKFIEQNNNKKNENNSEKALERINIDGINDYSMETYLTLVNESDRAFKKLADYFSNIDEPTIIAFLGDHQPRISSKFLNKLTNGEFENWNDEEMMQRYKVPFVIWANYDIEEQQIEATSMNFLQTKLIEAVGGSMTGYQKFLVEFQKQVPALTANGYFGADGNYYKVEDESSPYYEWICNYAILQYNNVIDTKNRLDDFFNL